MTRWRTRIRPTANMAEFLRIPSHGTPKGGLDLQDCLLHRFVAPLCRRSLRVRRPVSKLMAVFLFLPFSSAPLPG